MGIGAGGGGGEVLERRFQWRAENETLTTQHLAYVLVVKLKVCAVPSKLF